MSSQRYIETFPALCGIEGLAHGFVLKHPDIDVKTDRDTALQRLEAHHSSRLAELGISREHLATGHQVHGNRVAVVHSEFGPSHYQFPDTDGLVTGLPGQYLGIYVADCAAVFMVDPVKRVCALVHSGKKGTELAISTVAIEAMEDRYGTNPKDLLIQVSPCIRPPAYEVDFASNIVRNCVAAGVPETQVHDPGICTTGDGERYYSYRKEMGRTGRLFAVIGWRP